MKRLICISNIDWNFSWQRAQAFMSSLAKNEYKICFINNTGFAKPKINDIGRVFRRVFKKERLVFPEPNNIILFSPIVYPQGIGFNSFFNNFYFYPKIIKFLIDEGFDKPDILYSFLPTNLTISLIDHLHPKRTVYDYVGDFFSHPRKPKNLPEIHSQILRHSDLVLTDSEKLRTFLQADHNNIHILHNGVSKDFFNIKTGKVRSGHNSLCYFGTIDPQTLDFDLINKLAQKGNRISLIGTIKGTLPLLNNNITKTGFLPINTLTKEIEKSDVIIFPYKENDFNKSVMPAKLYQSLATGKPIISIGLPLLENSGFSPFIYLASNHTEFCTHLEKIHQIESEDKSLERKKLAERNSEEIHLKILLKLLSSI